MTEQSEVVQNLQKIMDKEPLAFKAIEDVIEHIAKTYSDKYQGEGASTIDTKQDLYHPKNGKAINIYQCKRYLQRYDTVNFNKSENPVDVKKAIHYLVFELTRLRISNNAKVGEDKID